ncbi:UDP-N-acetylmuramoyl-L-alanyl-D-glutamate--2,6-diaminopimelate ligase [Corynebacterium frankenforstense]|uniref:UDP-N-acetylmuramoyl-L-alanyl-D-glutamate--2, 6-diaminopimelate ligase n=1 Tax=Corynebacterium frankenforstense TaxID=1230998 RepID=UPI0009521807|nr:UDP-N-acetylmuramoyl-L-alanyl-D-glutamate--2,6-diaminopimelate ligase [Corynebacterium frankenforstense]
MAETLTRIAETAGAVIHAPGGAEVCGDVEVSGVDLVSDRLNEGDLFAALPGTHTHGAVFAAETPAAAILTDAAGAGILREAGETRPVLEVADVRAVLGDVAAELYGHPSRGFTVIGVTGTSGKTTVSYLVEAGLMAAGAKVGLIGTTGTRIDGRKIPTSLTTPEAPTLQALFRRMADEGVTHLVMEVSSHALALRRVLGVDFDVAGFTNLSQDHLDFHPTMEDYFQAKALLFDPASPMSAHRAVVCVDDDWGARMAGLCPDTLTVATHGQAGDVTVGEVTAAADGSQDFELTISDAAPRGVHLPLPGAFNVANASLAIALAERCGVDLDRFIAGLGGVSVPGRMQRVDRGQDFIAVVDYAHKPGALAEVLDTLDHQVDGRVAVVLGAGGERDHSKRPLMGAEAAKGADLVVVTDDNPRDEDPAPIRAAVVEGARGVTGGRATEIREIGSRREAIRAAVAWARPGDAVIVAGKGHETGQLVRGVTHPFDDREELAAALEARADGTRADETRADAPDAAGSADAPDAADVKENDR